MTVTGWPIAPMLRGASSCGAANLSGAKRIANHAAGPHQLGRSWLDGYLDGAAGRHVAKLSPVSHSGRLACHALRTALSSSAVRPVTGPPAVRAQDKVSRAVSESVRIVKPESRAGDVSRVAKPA